MAPTAQGVRVPPQYAHEYVRGSDRVLAQRRLAQANLAAGALAAVGPPVGDAQTSPADGFGVALPVGIALGRAAERVEADRADGAVGVAVTPNPGAYRIVADQILPFDAILERIAGIVGLGRRLLGAARAHNDQKTDEPDELDKRARRCGGGSDHGRVSSSKSNKTSSFRTCASLR